MQREKNNKLIASFVVSIITTAFFTILCFIILGTFYEAINYSIGVNVVVWVFTVIIAYMIYYVFTLIISLFIKKVSKPKLYNGWALLSGLIIITLICIFNSFGTDDYLFVEIMGLFSSIFAVFQIIYSIVLNNKSKNTKNIN